MKLTIVTIKDDASGAFSTPVFTASKGIALRSIKQEVNNPKNGDIYNYPEQFHMYYIGTFDDETGEFEQPKQPELMVDLVTLKQEQ